MHIDLNIYKTTTYKSAAPSKESTSELQNTSSELKAGIISAAIAAMAVSGIVIVRKSKSNNYIKTLAKDLSKDLCTKIKTSDLKPVMTKEEFLEITKTLKQENYIASPENIKNGTFIADFHSHSNFSDGNESIEKILNQAAEYGNKLNQINGKKFLFAISDHDGVEGVKEALRIIAQNPQKYANIRFIPAIELSFPIECQSGSKKFQTNFGNQVEMAEVLAYGINPFSKNSSEFFENLYKKRKLGISNTLELASKNIPDTKFCETEFNKYFLLNGNNYCMMNQHWAIYHYINLKTQITSLAKEQNKNPEELYETIMSELKNKGVKLNGDSLNNYLREHNLPERKYPYLQKVNDLKTEICPQVNGPIINAPSENSIESISEYTKNENAYIGFAHPIFTIRNYREENIKTELQNLIDKFGESLKFSENYHQSYPESENITKTEIENCSQITEDLGLISIGGRDKHNNNFKL